MNMLAINQSAIMKNNQSRDLDHIHTLLTRRGVSKIMKFLFYTIALYCTKISTLYADVYFIPTNGSDRHEYSAPYSGSFRAINGEVFNVSDYYETTSVELSMEGLALWDVKKGVTVTVPWSFDLGYDSELFQTDPVLQLGLSVTIYTDKSSLSFGATNLVTIGGHVRERPCADRLLREFHCGTGLPWVDRPAPNMNDFKDLSISYRMTF